MKCRRKTDGSKPEQHTMKNGRQCLKSKCEVCGTTKCRIIKSENKNNTEIEGGFSRLSHFTQEERERVEYYKTHDEGYRPHRVNALFLTSVRSACRNFIASNGIPNVVLFPPDMSMDERIEYLEAPENEIVVDNYVQAWYESRSLSRVYSILIR